MEREKIKCPGCGQEIVVNLQEFVDVCEEPEYKEKIMTGEFFMVKCPKCGAQTLAEHSVMYMDPSKKLTIYMAPGHDEDLLDQLNSLELPESEIDKEAVLRVVDDGSQLLEKILIYDGGRDDRVIELYKALIYENIREEWPRTRREDILYFIEKDTDFFIIWDYTNAAGEQLTVNLDEELYEELARDYMPALDVPAGKYAEVDAAWLAERVEVE